jgi:hypothetical protein
VLTKVFANSILKDSSDSPFFRVKVLPGDMAKNCWFTKNWGRISKGPSPEFFVLAFAEPAKLKKTRKAEKKTKNSFIFIYLN